MIVQSPQVRPVHGSRLDRPQTLELDLVSITKKFGPLVANDNISCRIEGGGVHAFLGENGAGKSTLMKIVCGYYQPDAGNILLNGKKITFASPAEARQLGIGMVHQQFTLVPSMTVLENVLLGDARTPFVLNLKREAERVSAKATEIGFRFDVNTPVWRLSMAERQKVELLKLLWRDTRIIVLDEPTSQLAPFEAEDILQTVQTLAQAGRIVVLITHHLDEIMRFSERITVLRKGKCVADVMANAIQADELARLMVDDLPPSTRIHKLKTVSSPKLSIKSVNVASSSHHRTLTDINLDIYEGEILGIAGVAASGQDEIAAILAGHLTPQTGTLVIDGKPSRFCLLKDPAFAASYIPAEPRKCTIVDSSTAANLILRDVHEKENSVGPFLHRRRLADRVTERIQAFEIRPENPEVQAGHLSGGNLQRLFLAREFSHKSPLLVTVNPTAGLDLAMSQRVRHELEKQAQSGRAVVLVSPDLNELLEVADRIAVVCGGKLVGVEPASELNPQALGLMLGGISADIVRSIAHCLVNDADTLNAEAKATLIELLGSTSIWQRRLAAQLALKSFGQEDLELIETRLAIETDQLCLAWLTVCLTKFNAARFAHTLETRFAQNHVPYLEVLRSLLGLEDLASLNRKLSQPLPPTLPEWQKALARLAMQPVSSKDAHQSVQHRHHGQIGSLTSR
jgi:general nucleoside transport system ATP-binding protein